ncbi:MAG: hypothetical protein FJW30_19545 [Acidobacteria bacterium]|nr:hypothetical protein [Acidobacteriota bacterium]
MGVDVEDNRNQKPLHIDDVLEVERKLLRRRHPCDDVSIGIACSGGGIRSGTFNLGILTVLEKMNLLDKTDYLSTVSGGGYIGSYVVANRMKGQDLRDESNENPALAHLRRFSNYLTPSVGVMSADTWTMMMVWFRNTSMLQLFLLSVFGALLLLGRVWTWGVEAAVRVPWIAGYLSTVSIGVMHVMVAVICAVLIHSYGPPQPLSGRLSSPGAARRVLIGVVFMALLGCTLFIVGAFDSFRQPDLLATGLVTHFALTLGFCGFYLSLFSLGYGRGFRKESGRGRRIVFGAAWVLASTFFCSQLEIFGAVAANLLLLLVILGDGGISIFHREPKEAATDIGRSVAAGLGCAVASVAGILTANVWLGDWAYRAHLVLTSPAGPYVLASKEIWEYALFAAPGLLATLGCCIIVMLGIAGRAMPDIVREGWSRLGALLYMKGAAFLILGILGVFGPLWLLQAWNAGNQYILASGGLLTALAGAFSVFAANSGDTSGKENVSPWKERLVGLAPIVFILTLFCVVAILLHAGFVYDTLSARPEPGAVCVFPVEANFESARVPVLGERPVRVTSGAHFVLCGPNGKSHWQGPGWPGLDDMIRFHWQFLQSSISSQFQLLFSVLIGLTLLALVLASRLDVNEYSINRFYRNRITRCFLGAAREKNSERRPDPVTGFDVKDDDEFEMSKVAGFLNSTGDPYAAKTPLPIINTALNVVGGSNAALQERRARSFFFSPFHGYSDGTGGFELSELSTGRFPGQVPLGSLVAISGAAANPNMGFHTSPAVAFLLTFFNVRLGWWLGIPGRVSPIKKQFNLSYIFFELFGAADEDDAYVNLSDGGHFENLGLYELVRRKCKLIIVGDGEQDDKYIFESLGMAIRRCRIDHNVDIEIDVAGIRPKEAGGPNGRHWAVGRIKYDENEFGYILYLKSSFTGREPYDVQQYRFSNPAFPQQSTADQFFNESQFESYRQLGIHTAQELLTGAMQATPKFGRKDWYRSAEELFLRSS